MKNRLPKILRQQAIAKTRIFCVEELELEFSNGAKRVYERLVSGKQGAVMVVAVNQNQELLLVREYSAGTHDYQLAFPKGIIEIGETPEQAANRELKEETGFGANQLQPLKSLALAPGYFTHQMQLFLATDLYPQKLPGDEPEEIELVPWPLADLEQLLSQPDFAEARSIAALFLAKTALQVKLKKNSNE